MKPKYRCGNCGRESGEDGAYIEGATQCCMPGTGCNKQKPRLDPTWLNPYERVEDNEK